MSIWTRFWDNGILISPSESYIQINVLYFKGLFWTFLGVMSMLFWVTCYYYQKSSDPDWPLMGTNGMCDEWVILTLSWSNCANMLLTKWYVDVTYLKIQGLGQSKGHQDAINNLNKTLLYSSAHQIVIVFKKCKKYLNILSIQVETWKVGVQSISRIYTDQSHILVPSAELKMSKRERDWTVT